MSPAGFVREVFQRDKPLAFAGAWMLLQAALFVVLMPFDDRTILGIDPWVKPFKFCVSVGIYLWTLAWLLLLLRVSSRVRGFLSWSFSLVMLVEVGCVVLQSVRGVRSHFNFETGFDGSVFGLMGMLIAVNTALLVSVLVLFLVRPSDIPGTYLWGIRLGLLVTLLASTQGGLILGKGQHVVGVEDGGPGLPFVNWSVEAGDLRVSHMIGLHGMPVLPLFAIFLGRWKPSWSEARSKNTLFAFTAIYVLVEAGLLVQALSGVPFIGT